MPPPTPANGGDVATGNGWSGTPARYMTGQLDYVVGWEAIYAVGDDPVVIYNSRPGRRIDPRTLPGTGLQFYNVYWHRWGKTYLTVVSGYDEVSMIGRRLRVMGEALTDERFYGELTDLLDTRQANRHGWRHAE